MLHPGDVFEKYRIIKLIGSGGMAEIYLAEHILLKTYYAIKVMKNNSSGNKELLCKRFLREAKCVLQLKHPNIVRVYDAGCDSVSGHLFIAMEYISGGNISADRNHRFSEAELLNIGEDIAEALSELARQHIVHRDIKPSNIMRDADGNYKLMDLGIAKCDTPGGEDYTLTMGAEVFGTPAYASPEQCHSPHNVDLRSDIYSLGVTLYHLASGIQPFEEKNPVAAIMRVVNENPPPLSRISNNYSRQFSCLISSMMNKSPYQRPQTADELLRRIKNVKNSRRKMLAGNQKNIFGQIFYLASVVWVAVLVLTEVQKEIPVSSRSEEIIHVSSAAAVARSQAVPEKRHDISPPNLRQQYLRLGDVCRRVSAVNSRNMPKCAFKPVETARINSLLEHTVKYHGTTSGWKLPPFANWHIHIGHAAQKARKNKKMLLIFTTRSLAAPEYLSGDDDFRKWLDERFVLVFCDCDYLNMPKSQKQHLETFFRLLKIEIAPSTVILGHDGKYLAYIPGQRNLQPALYRTILNEVHLGKRVHFDRNYNYLYSSEK